jgi:hypothetical protein
MKVLVNGCLGRRICHARGLRQGDPLSPLLFVLVMEVLNAMVYEADQQWLLSPLPGSHFGQRMSLYADDLLLFLAPTQGGFPLHPRHPRPLRGRIGADHERRQMSHLADTVLGGGNRPRAASVPMPAFAAALPLPGRAPICGEAAAHGRAETVGCRSQSYPHLEGKAAKRGGQDDAHPRHTFCHTSACVSITRSLSAWAIQQIDKCRRAFLWSGTDAVAGGSCKVAWPVVCAPKCYGGLGPPDLRVLGFALRLRWEWQKRTPGVPAWTQLPSKYALYGQEDETVDHLFASCVFAREVWFRVLHPSGWDPLSPTAHSPLSTWWSDGRSTVPAQLRRGFDSAVLLVSWRL